MASGCAAKYAPIFASHGLEPTAGGGAVEGEAGLGRECRVDGLLGPGPQRRPCLGRRRPLQDLDGPHAPWITSELLREQELLLPRPVFERLWLNRWQHSDGDFVTLAEAEACRDDALAPQSHGQPGLRYFAAIDYAEKHDHTAGLVLHCEIGPVGGARPELVVDRTVHDALDRYHAGLIRGQPMEARVVIHNYTQPTKANPTGEVPGRLQVTRQAGSQQAIAATNAIVATTPTIVTGSVGCTPNNSDAISRLRANAPARPAPTPTTVSTNPCFMI